MQTKEELLKTLMTAKAELKEWEAENEKDATQFNLDKVKEFEEIVEGLLSEINNYDSIKAPRKSNTKFILWISLMLVMVINIFIQNVYYTLFSSMVFITYCIFLMVPRKQKLTPKIFKAWLEIHLNKDFEQIITLCSMLLDRTIKLTGANKIQIDTKKNSLIFTNDLELIKRINKTIEIYENE